LPSDGPGDREFRGSARFHLLRKLGQGGSGVGYLAHDRQREATVALKTLSGLKPTNLFRFKQEFRGLSDIHRARSPLAGSISQNESYVDWARP
jgi:serine/threonine protein kinase